MNRKAAVFFLLYLGAILYLSLYPWRFVPESSLRTLQWVPLNNRRTLLDAGLNVVFYMPLGAAAFLSIRPRALAVIAAPAIGLLISLAVEWTQLSIPTRFGNLTDLACNTIGALLGVLTVLAATSPPLGSRLRILYSPGFLLIGLWAIWQVFLLLPRYGPAIDTSHEVVGLCFLAVVAAHRKIGIPAFRKLTWLALIWLAAEELRPFRFEGPPRPFWWLPFESWFVGAPESYYGAFFGKLFFYTAILWMERQSALRWITALVGPGLILLAGELVQVYLPGRTPEITDVALLAAGAVLLRLVETPSPG